MLEIHSIWHVQTKYIQKKVKNINLLLLLIILLWTQFPQANKAYLRKSCENTVCPDSTWTDFLFDLNLVSFIWYKYFQICYTKCSDNPHLLKFSKREKENCWVFKSITNMAIHMRTSTNKNILVSPKKSILQIKCFWDCIPENLYIRPMLVESLVIVTFYVIFWCAMQ